MINILSFILIIILIIITVKKLKEQVKDLTVEHEIRIKNKEIKEDIIPIKNISNDNKVELKEESIIKEKEIPIKKEINKHPKNNSNKIDLKKIELYQPNYQPKNEITKEVIETKREAYTKNVLNERTKVTSPISITNEDKEFNVNEFIPRRTDIKNNNSKDYLEEISKQIEKEIKPQTIELTSYEQEQEDNAIISYKELLNVKDKITIKDDEEETVEFIEELKKLRNSLN